MIYLVTGGSGSGKSLFAEKLLCACKAAERKYYIATMQAYGEEGRARVEKHRRMREGKGFITIEQPIELEMAALQFDKKKSSSAIVECVSNIVANEMFGTIFNPLRVFDSRENVKKRTTESFKALAGELEDMVIVTNNVFDDGISYDASTAEYIRALAEINIFLAHFADAVVEVTAGMPIIWKGEAGLFDGNEG